MGILLNLSQGNNQKKSGVGKTLYELETGMKRDSESQQEIKSSPFVNIPSATDWRKTQPMSVKSTETKPKQNFLQSAISGITKLGERATNETIDWLQSKNQNVSELFKENLDRDLWTAKKQGVKLSPQGEKLADEFGKKQKEQLTMSVIGATEPLKIVGGVGKNVAGKVVSTLKDKLPAKTPPGTGITKKIQGEVSSSNIPAPSKTNIPQTKTPETQKINQSLLQKYTQKVSNAMTRAVENIQNTEERVRQIVGREDVKVSDISNPYLKMTLYPGKVSSKIEIAKKEIGDILQESQKSGVTRKEISDYLIARHAPERNLALGEKAAGITTQEAKTSLAALESSQKGVKIKELSDRVQKINNQTLDILKDSGVISDDLYATLRNKYKNHVPLNRIMDTSDDIGQVLSGKGYNVKSTGIKKAVGSEKEVSDIMGNVVLNYEQAVLRSEKNIVDQATLAFVKNNKDALKGVMEIVKPKAIGKTFDGKPIMETTNDPTILNLFDKGKKVWIKIKDPNLAVAFQGTGKEKLGGLFNAVGAFTRLYSQLQTRFNPAFAFPNKIRDLQETAVYLSTQSKVGAKGALKMSLRDSASVIDVTNYLRGKMTPGAKMYQEMKELGGTTGGFSLSTKKRVDLSLEQMEKLASSKVGNVGNRLLEYIDNWNTIFEDSTRLSVFKTALEKGLSKEQAAAMAKEASINFNRMGKGGPVINSLWMFANASIQGSAKMISSLKNPKVLAGVVASVGTAVAVTSKYNDMADPEWRDKVSKWDKLNGLPVVVPSIDGTFRYFTIPVSWGLKPIKLMADYADDAMGGRSFDARDMAEKLTAVIVNSYNPVGGTDIASSITPTIADLPVELARNKSWSGSQIRPTLYNKNTPADIQYFTSLRDTGTGKAAISISEFLQKNADIKVSPADIKYVFDQTVGGTGKTAAQLGNTLYGAFTGKPIPISEYPIFSRFYRERQSEEIGAGTMESERIKEIGGKGAREKFKFKLQAEDLYNKIKNEPNKEVKKQLLLEQKDNPEMIKKLAEISKEKAKELTNTERAIINLQVENGDRAEYIIEKVKSLKTKEEKKSYILKMYEKGILTKDTIKSMLEMIKKNK